MGSIYVATLKERTYLWYGSAQLLNQ